MKEEVKNLEARNIQLVDQNNRLKLENDNLEVDIANKKITVRQLNQIIDRLDSVLNSIKQGDITYQNIEQIAKEVGRSLILSRMEALICAVLAVILTLKREPNFIPLLMAPIPALHHPGFQEHFKQLGLKAWDELSGQVNIMVMTGLFEGLRVVVDNSKRQRT